MILNTIQEVDCLVGLTALPPQCVNTCVTSPPYYALRDYGIPKSRWPDINYTLFGFEVRIPAMECCLGLEDSPEAFIGHMVHVFRLVHRVLKDDGTCWINIGDSFAGGGNGAANYPDSAGIKQNSNQGSSSLKGRNGETYGLKRKDLIGIPWMLAFALREDGWYLRQDIIWSKPNPMPESVQDRCTKSHEYIFLLSKSERYYYDIDAIKTSRKTDLSKQKYAWGRAIDGSISDTRKGTGTEIRNQQTGRKPRPEIDSRGGNQAIGDIPHHEGKANKRSVWTVATRSFKEAHFATFPEELIVDCIKAGCPEEGTVLDPFGGSGTTAIVARKLNRNFIVYEIKPQYKSIGDNRLFNSLGLFQ